MYKKFSLLLLIFISIMIINPKITGASTFSLPMISEINYDSYNSYDFSRNGELLVTSSNEGSLNEHIIEFWNVKNGLNIGRIEENSSYTKAKFIQNDTSILTVGLGSPDDFISNEIIIKEWDIKSGKLKREIANYEIGGQNSIGSVTIYSGGLTGISLNQDYSQIYVGLKAYIYVFDFNTGQLITKIPSNRYSITSFAYNSISNNLAIASNEEVNIYNGNTFEKLKTINFNSQVTSINYSGDGNHLIVQENSAPLKLFDVKNDYKVKFNLKIYVDAIATTNDGKYLIVNNDDSLDIYDILQGNLVSKTYKGYIDSDISISHDDSKVIIGTTIFDLKMLEKKEIIGIDILEDSSTIIGLNEYMAYEVIGVANDDTIRFLSADEVTWSIEDTDIAEVRLGQIFGKSIGKTKITAMYNGFENTKEVTVANIINDVPPTHPNFEAIHYLKTLGVINGYSDGNFKPDVLLQRQHVVALIARSGIELPAIRPAKMFTDVPKTNSNYNNIQNLYRAGIIDGSGNKFNPSNNITNKQLAKILVNAYSIKKIGDTSYSFKDISKSDWSHEYASIMVSNGFMPISSDSNFYSTEYVTRGEYAQYIYNIIKNEF